MAAAGLRLPGQERSSRDDALEDRRLAHAVLDSSGLLIVVLDLESRVVRSNRAYREFAGLSDDAATGQLFPIRPAPGAAPDAPQPAAYAAWFAAVAQGADPPVWEQSLSADATAVRRIDWRGHRLPGAGGQPDGLLLVGVDVTGQRHIEDQARRRRAAASQLHRLHLANELAGAFGHELSQPLAAMVAFADVAAQRHARAGNAAGSGVVSEFEEIAMQARRAAQLLAALRRVVAKGGSEPAHACGLNALVRSACELLQDEARAAGVALDCQFAEPEVTVLAETARLEHALVHLVRNAIEAVAQHRGDASGVVRVLVQPLDDGASARVSVLDDGPGIAPDQAEQVFRPFHTTKANNLGLGLRFARTVIEAHSGRLWAEPSRQGGTFHVTLPVLDTGPGRAGAAP